MLINKNKIRLDALKILGPIKSIDENAHDPKSSLFYAQRSSASYDLPEYYLIYFLLNDLLGFKDLGRFDKIAWSFPIEYEGKYFLIEYRKSGVGIFVINVKNDEILAKAIAKKINGATKSARPFFDHLAKEAVFKSKFNIVNNNSELFDRYKFLLSLYKIEKEKQKAQPKNEVISQNKNLSKKNTSYKNSVQNANWLAISCIESFFSWTEHLFIHLAVLSSNQFEGTGISELIDAEWKYKFKAAIADESKEATIYYNDLHIVRQQLRNFVAHGAFGKDMNAFSFHSGAGLVPVIMSRKRNKNRFSLQGSLSFKEDEVIKLIEGFIDYLWKDTLAPAMYYTQECGLPTILTNAANGKYKEVTKSMAAMKEYVFYVNGIIDKSIDMDW